MYCKNCGKEMNDNAAVCLSCGAAKDTGDSFCANCGNEVNKNAVVCLSCGADISSQGSNVQKSNKTKIVAGLLAIFLGHLGIHWFYLGFNNKGVKNIILTVASAVLIAVMGLGVIGFIGIWIYNIITAVRIFTGNQNDANGNILS